MLHLKRYGGDVKQRGRVDDEAIRYGQAHFELECHKLRGQRAVGKVIAKLTSRELQGKQVAHWDFERSLDWLHGVKEALEAGLLKSKAEMAAYCGLQRSAAPRIIDKGVRYRVWTDANIEPWLSKGRTRRQAGRRQHPPQP
jgi:hypothetical protein